MHDRGALLEPGERTFAGRVRDAGVDGGVLDLLVTQVFLHELERLARIEEMGRNRVPHRMAAGTLGQLGKRRVLLEELLNPPLLERARATAKEADLWISCRGGGEKCVKEFPGACKEWADAP